jgi:hypothetical protein
MTNPDIFALRNSDLNPFLFSKVGTETSGAELTVLSVLARRGVDPWVEARRLSRLSKLAAALWLADKIKWTSLTKRDLAEAGTTAARVVRLLPAQSADSGPGFGQVAAGLGTVKIAQWIMIAMLLGALAVGMVAILKTPMQPTTSHQAGQQHP